ncbi:hypothetical protein G5714_004161 [Onychostoma macrolepis]|uniref:Uncharacterized protein n=1 Tax=Onychostoma macrolepis TaxID=369639 RepID=A0A7J6DBN4_9TELE|nr:hypothetical protein G5714_004161 [Onychostoma macrolepis]
MKNAKSLCKKHAPNNYKLAMHVLGLLTTASSLVEFDEMLTSCTVVFSSPCSSENVEKHFNNIQTLLTTIGESAVDDRTLRRDVKELNKVSRYSTDYLKCLLIFNNLHHQGRIPAVNAVNAVLLVILVCFTAVCQADDEAQRINFT